MPFPNPDTQFKPGWKGGPGRPPGKKPLTEMLAAVLEGDVIAGKKLPGGMTVNEAVIVGLVKACMRGNPAAIREAFDRIEGKVKEARGPDDPDGRSEKTRGFLADDPDPAEAGEGQAPGG